MLTGESLPVNKISTDKLINLDLNHPMLNASLQKHLLYNGTNVVSIEGEAVALVIRTGFRSSKGMLIRSILHPKPQSFKFYKDSIIFVMFLAFIAFLGFLFTIYQFTNQGESIYVIIVAGLDLITIAVPPGLISCLSVGLSIAMLRLKSKSIFCISPTRINVAGQINFCLFDKTGTLTINNLILKNVIDDSLEASSNLKMEQQVIMSACHSLLMIENKICGDPLDIEMFKYTGSRFLSSTKIETSNKSVIEIIKTFDFDPVLRRMSTIVNFENNLYCLTKGAPESVLKLLHHVPPGFESALELNSKLGYRILALAINKIVDGEIVRELTEKQMTFVGFLIYENKLKDDTPSTILELQNANIHCAMCTGDNLLTAIAVAKSCNMLKNQNQGNSLLIPILEGSFIKWKNYESLETLNIESKDMRHFEFAIDGDAFEFMRSTQSKEYLQNVVSRTIVFARMNPEQKKNVAELIRENGYYVMFTGDGANDCAALKTCDVGLSLSDAEASIAAPFTSKNFEISCVPELIKEGRASLVTSFGCFKFMALYSMIQFSSVTILYSIGANLGDLQFLYVDLALVLPLAVLMSNSKSAKQLSSDRPDVNLFSPKVLIPLVLHILTQLLGQIGMYYFVQKQSFYKPPVVDFETKEFTCFETSAIFLYSNFLYIIYAFLYYAGAPHRMSMQRSRTFLLAITISTLLCVFILFSNLFNSLLSLLEMPVYFKFLILLYSMASFGILWIFEHIVFLKFADLVKARKLD
eukprot:NODE_49_length_31687_cov_0.791123.p4 type:complete len:753 gc:universal NODE_49_length_31687_cov_0.791123:2-2260(+)